MTRRDAYDAVGDPAEETPQLGLRSKRDGSLGHKQAPVTSVVLALWF